MRKIGLVALLFSGLLFAAAGSVYGDTAIYTGDSDIVKFPATMDNDGPPITYEADRIGLGVNGSVGLPHEPYMGKGDFVYTMDLAMTDFEDVGGYYGQSMRVDFLPSGQFVEFMILNYGDSPRKYFWNQFLGTNWDHNDDDNLGANPGVGDIAIRMTKSGTVLTGEYQSAVSGEWVEMVSVDLATTSLDPDSEWALRLSNWGTDGAVNYMDEISVKYAPYAKYTGDSDTIKFPATMDNDGPPITYEADTIGLGVNGSVGLPHEPYMGKGDFVYIMDLAMTDFEDVGGYYGQSMRVDFLPSGQFVEFMILNYGDSPRKYFWNQFLGTNWDHNDDDNLGANPGVGDIAIRMTKSGTVLTGEYQSAVSGEWVEMVSVDLTTTSLDPDSEWRLSLSNWGTDGAVNKMDEITVQYSTFVNFTSEDDVIKLPATMENDGPPITYTGDTIGLGVNGGLTLPGFERGKGDFVYIMDLAMTDFEDVGGYYGQSMRVDFLPSEAFVEFMYLNYGDSPRKYFWNQFLGTNWDHNDDDNLGANAGVGDIAVRVSKSGSILAAEYQSAVSGEWVEMVSVDLTTTSLDPDSDWRFRISNWGTDGDVFSMDEISVFLPSAAPEPWIVLLGEEEMRCEEGPECLALHPWTDPGAVATDGQDGNITADIVVGGETDALAAAIADALEDPVEESSFGTYTITYNVTDSDLNPAEEMIRTVTVAKETAPPVITLLGDAQMTVGHSLTYDEPGAVALDARDGDISANVVIGGTDAFCPGSTPPECVPTVLGDFPVTYNVTDERGNAAIEVTRTVTVADLTGPAVTLTGEPFIQLDQGVAYTEQGSTALDNVDGDVTAGIVIGYLDNDVCIEGSAVDTATVGIYYVCYAVSDAVENLTVAKRTVQVLDITGPAIALTVDEVTQVSQWSSFDFEEITATALDDIDGDVSGKITVSGSVDTTMPGDYVLTYTVTDSAGNTSSVTRTINVGADMTAPVITLIGGTEVTMPQGGTYADEGATVIDDVDGDLSDDIVVDASQVDSSTLGEYTVTLSATDAAGNTGTATRNVVVETDTTPPVITIKIYDAAKQILHPVLTSGDTYRDNGASAFDDADLDISQDIVTKSWLAMDADGNPIASPTLLDDDDAVDTAVPGTYYISYNASDSVGNQAVEKIRTVTITYPGVRGIVTDPAGNVVEGALVELYLPMGNQYNLVDPSEEGKYLVESSDDFFEWRYSAYTTSLVTVGEGDDAYSYNYRIPIPMDAPLDGFTVVATMEGYVSTPIPVDPDADTAINISLIDKTEIVSVTANAGATKVSLTIVADPQFTDVSQVIVVKKSGDNRIDQNTLSLAGNGSISVDYTGTDDFSALIGYPPAEMIYRYEADDADYAVSYGGVGPGYETSVDATAEFGQPVEVEVPSGGFAQLEKATVKIRQIPVEAATVANEGSPGYIYEIVLLSHITLAETDISGLSTVLIDAGDPLPDAYINRVVITLPIDLRIVGQGDLESGDYVIYRADSAFALSQPGQGGTAIPASQILDTDYVGDGEVGSVTFWTDSLSVFGIGAVRTELGDDSVDTSTSGCFINTVAKERSSDRSAWGLLILASIAATLLPAVWRRSRGKGFGKLTAGLVALAACLSFVAVPAQAEEGKFYADFKGMYVFQNYDEGHSMGKFTGPAPSISFDDSVFGAQVGFGYVIDDRISIKALLELIPEIEALTGLSFQAWDRISVVTASINCKLILSEMKRAKPYLIGGMGVISAEEDIYYRGSKTSKTRDLSIGFRAGLGVDLFITDNVSVGLEGAYTAGIGDVEQIKYATVSFGLGYHF